MSTIRSLTPDSSSIASVAYMPGSQALDIQFRNGAVYRYFRVPATIYSEIVVAPSKGRYFHQAIRGVFAYKRVASGRGLARQRSYL